jgi:hypothetical protein
MQTKLATNTHFEVTNSRDTYDCNIDICLYSLSRGWNYTYRLSFISASDRKKYSALCNSILNLIYPVYEYNEKMFWLE